LPKLENNINNNRLIKEPPFDYLGFFRDPKQRSRRKMRDPIDSFRSGNTSPQEKIWQMEEGDAKIFYLK
jgi:hypothetical protein